MRRRITSKEQLLIKLNQFEPSHVLWKGSTQQLAEALHLRWVKNQGDMQLMSRMLKHLVITGQFTRMYSTLDESIRLWYVFSLDAPEYVVDSISEVYAKYTF